MKIRVILLALVILTVSTAPARPHMASECARELVNLYTIGGEIGLSMKRLEREFEGDFFDALLIYKWALETLTRAVLATQEPCDH